MDMAFVTVLLMCHLSLVCTPYVACINLSRLHRRVRQAFIYTCPALLSCILRTVLGPSGGCVAVPFRLGVGSTR